MFYLRNYLDDKSYLKRTIESIYVSKRNRPQTEFALVVFALVVFNIELERGTSIISRQQTLWA